MSETFGRYTVVGQLGRGAMGVVYLASDPLLNRQVAIKTVDLAVDDPEEREFLRTRLLRDARAAAVLKHPNIVSIHDVFEDSERAYVVMELVEGESLLARLKTNPLPEVATLLQVLRQMADALDYTHSRGVIHRDIKPANVMIRADGTAKIMDFGIARISDTRTCTPTGMVMGTVEYMAPEQIRGETVDGRADQFALGVVAYQMMTGSTLFGRHTLATLTYKIVNETPPPPSTRNGVLPRGVDAVLAKALAKTPSERFTNCCEFVSALAHAFSDAPTIQVGPVPAVADRPIQPIQPVMAAAKPAAPAAPATRSRSAVPVVAVAVLFAGVALAVWKPWNRIPRMPDRVAADRPATATPVPSREPVAPSKPNDFKPAEPNDGKPTTAVSTAPMVTAPRETLRPVAPRPAEPPARKEPPVADPAKGNSTPPKAAPPPVAPKHAEPVDREEETELLPPPPVAKPGTNPTQFDTAAARGHEQLRSKDYSGAIQSFTKVIGLRPNHAPAYFNRGVAHQNLEQNEMAIQDYSTAIRLAPEMALAFAARGVCLVRLHRDPDALPDFQRALQSIPDLPSALNGRGGIYFRRQQFRMALADYDAAIKSNPRFAQAFANRAKAREAVGDFRGAAADRQREAELRKR
jgi:Flp pilus assembly protein TadD